MWNLQEHVVSEDCKVTEISGGIAKQSHCFVTLLYHSGENKYFAFKTLLIPVSQNMYNFICNNINWYKCV